MSELLVEVKRGSLVESRHFGDLVIVNRQGDPVWSVGNPSRVTYARSSAKPLQALPLVESGAADFFHMTTEEIALACASHSGEPEHVKRVTEFLNRIGIPTSALQCGAHAPYHADSHTALLRNGESFTVVHNNCSGKHAGMLAMTKFLGADLNTYLQLGHPLQQAILDAVADVCQIPREDVTIGTDGCGVPVFGLPIQKLAFAFAQFAKPEGLDTKRAAAMTRIRNAMIQHPHLVAGTERFCTGLMEAGQGAILGKAGAEGVYCLGVLDQGYGMCVKVDDGNARAAYPAVVEALQQSGIVDNAVIERLESFHRPLLKNHQGTLVGSLEPVFQLQSAADIA